MKKIIQTNILALTLLFAFTNCSQNNNENQVNEENAKTVPNKKDNYTLNDLISFSKSKYGFVENDGTLNEYYGDFDFVSNENIFDFNVGCGSAGDIISIVIKINPSKSNYFDLYIAKGENYFGKPADTDKKVGEFVLISENEIQGQIKLCLNEDSGCCGFRGEDFILKKLSTNTEGTINKE